MASSIWYSNYLFIQISITFQLHCLSNNCQIWAILLQTLFWKYKRLMYVPFSYRSSHSTVNKEKDVPKHFAKLCVKHHQWSPFSYSCKLFCGAPVITCLHCQVVYWYTQTVWAKSVVGRGVQSPPFIFGPPSPFSHLPLLKFCLSPIKALRILQSRIFYLTRLSKSRYVVIKTLLLMVVFRF